MTVSFIWPMIKSYMVFSLYCNYFLILKYFKANIESCFINKVNFGRLRILKITLQTYWWQLKNTTCPNLRAWLKSLSAKLLQLKTLFGLPQMLTFTMDTAWFKLQPSWSLTTLEKSSDILTGLTLWKSILISWSKFMRILLKNLSYLRNVLEMKGENVLQKWWLRSTLNYHWK